MVKLTVQKENRNKNKNKKPTILQQTKTNPPANNQEKKKILQVQAQ
jgi:hypothetical protein